MKTLYLIRHAKSDWSIPGLPDIDRHLNPRGYKDAHRMGKKIKEHLSREKIFISSPAIRALSTALIIARECNHPPGKIRIEKELYEAEEKEYFKVISNIDDKFETAFIFGHNPTISNVFSELTDSIVSELPTCSVSVIEFKADSWKDCMAVKKRVIEQIFPSQLKEQD